MRQKALKLSFTAIFSLLIGTFSYAAEPVMGSEVNEAMIAQVEAENEALAKVDSKESGRLPASVEDEEPKK